MKIVLHGATNGHNFGDFLFASMFYERLIENGHEVFFYQFPRLGINEFYRKHLHYKKKCTIKTLLTADALIYFSGGYFGERTNSKKETIIRYLTYLPVGELFRVLKKKILIIGVGGAPISHKWLRNKIVKIINYASLVIFRDDYTTNYYLKHGVNNEIETTVDTAISLVRYRLPNKTRVKKYLIGEKNLFLHVPGNKKTDEKIINTIAPAINEFLNNNSGWNVIIGGDNANNVEINTAIKKRITSCKVVLFNYDDPWLLYDLLGNVDLIITAKLHVGIIGSSFGKSVLSFPYHSMKTKRFYEQIGESTRCIPIVETSKEIVVSQLNKYSDLPISISDDVFEQSEQNLKKMIERLSELSSHEK